MVNSHHFCLVKSLYSCWPKKHTQKKKKNWNHPGRKVCVMIRNQCVIPKLSSFLLIHSQFLDQLPKSRSNLKKKIGSSPENPQKPGPLLRQKSPIFLTPKPPHPRPTSTQRPSGAGSRAPAPAPPDAPRSCWPGRPPGLVSKRWVGHCFHREKLADNLGNCGFDHEKWWEIVDLTLKNGEKLWI